MSIPANTELVEELQKQIRLCRKCGKCGYPVSPNPVFSGPATARVMLIGQAPGSKNAVSDFPFNGGQSGKRLFGWLAEVGWTEDYFRTHHYISSVTRCYPGQKTHGDRVPSLQEQQLCGEWRRLELELLNIEVIIPMGKLAINLFFDRNQPLDKIIGSCFEIDRRMIVPIPHPSGASPWHLKPENRQLLHQAMAHLKRLRDEKNL